MYLYTASIYGKHLTMYVATVCNYLSLHMSLKVRIISPNHIYLDC